MVWKDSLRCLVVFWMAIASTSFADEESRLSDEDRLDDLEARLIIMQEDLESTKKVAEQERANILNPSISAVIDFIGQYGIGVHGHDGHEHEPEHGHEGDYHAHDFKNGAFVREIEFEFRAAVDPFATDAVVTVAIEPHNSEHVIHLEDAYAFLRSLPMLSRFPLDLSAKFGRFPTAFGRMNRIHLHNIPQITYPLAHRAFLGEEGYRSQGISLETSFVPSDKTAVTVFAESIFQSRTPMQEKGAEKIPSGVAHVWLHQELVPFHFLDVGLSALVGRKNKNKDVFWLFGNDIHYGYTPPGYGQNPVFLFGNELFLANQNEGQGRWPLGNFTWAQVKLLGSSFFGLRYDLAPKEKARKEFQHSASAYLSYYTSEFLRIRLGYEHVMPALTSFAGDHRLMLSMMFIFGSHPVEPYFIKR